MAARGGPRTSGTGRAGKGRAAPKPSAATIATEQAECLKLRLDGCTVQEIADQTGYPRSTVQDRLDAALIDLVHPAADAVRQLELARLDRWQVRLEKRMEDEEPAERVVPVALQVQARRAKLLGLDAPERVEQSTTLSSADPAVEALLQRGRDELTA